MTHNRNTNSLVAVTKITYLTEGVETRTEPLSTKKLSLGTELWVGTDTCDTAYPDHLECCPSHYLPATPRRSLILFSPNIVFSLVRTPQGWLDHGLVEGVRHPVPGECFLPIPHPNEIKGTPEERLRAFYK